MQVDLLRPNEIIAQADVQAVQEDFCKFLMQEVLKTWFFFFDPDSDYATNPKYDALCRDVTTTPFFHLLGPRYN